MLRAIKPTMMMKKLIELPGEEQRMDQKHS